MTAEEMRQFRDRISALIERDPQAETMNEEGEDFEILLTLGGVDAVLTIELV